MKIRELFFRYIVLIFTFLGSDSVLIAQEYYRKGDIFQTNYFITGNGRLPMLRPLTREVDFLLLSEGDAILLHNSGFTWWPAGIADAQGADSAAPKSSVENEKTGVMELIWLNVSDSLRIETSEPSSHYFILGKSQTKAFGYKKVIYKSIYKGIDLVYEAGGSQGIKYSFILHPGADPEQIQYTYKGKNLSLILSENGESLRIVSPDFQFYEHGLVVYDELGKVFPCRYKIRGEVIGFDIGKINREGITTIDPWVNRITTLTQNNCCNPSRTENKGFDVDFDHSDHLYVYGGDGFRYGNQLPYNTFKVAKYDSTGILKWTFLGEVDTIGWNSSSNGNGYVSNFLVDKVKSGTYIGQSYAYTAGGAVVIRLDSNGFWDGFETKKDKKLIHIWDINFHPTSDSILCFGGDKTNAEEVGIAAQNGNMVLRSFTKTVRNARDVVHSVADPGGAIFTIFIGEYDTSIDNKLVRPTDDFTSYYWKEYSGFNSFNYWRNKVIDSQNYYMFANGYNALAANDHYLFFYDGKHIAAFNKKTGKLAGKADTIGNHRVLYQGGIGADNCNYIYIGGDSANIKIYRFKDSVFTYIKDVILGKKQRQFIRDVRYNPSSRKLFITGDSIVASFVSPVECEDSCLALVFNPDPPCTGVITARLKKADSVSQYTFEWRDSTNQNILRESSGKLRFSDTLENIYPEQLYFLRIYRNKHIGGLYRDYTIATLRSYSKSDTVLLCEGDTFYLDGTTYFDSGWVTDSLFSVHGCDSVHRYYLQLLKPSHHQQKVRICLSDSLKVGKSVYTRAGNYLDTMINSVGCDSIIRTELIVEYDSVQQVISLCEGDSIAVGNMVYTETGRYKNILKGFYGCDSLVYTDLTVNRDTIINISGQLCAGDSFVIAGKVYITDGVFTDTLSRLTGCDSVLVVRIERISAVDSVIVQRLCNQNSVVIHGRRYTVPGNYADTFTGYQGCDSVVHIQLTTGWVSADFSVDSAQRPRYEFYAHNPANHKTFWLVDKSVKDSLASQFSWLLTSPGQQYEICFVASDSAGCTDTSCIYIQFQMPEYQIFNVFTPGNDGKNDKFKIGYTGGEFSYDLRIFNRWGVLVYQVQDVLVGDADKWWNGRVMNTGSACPSGSYFGQFQFYVNGKENMPEMVSVAITLIWEE